ncbi:unnamed protein product [Chrysoparadoxa australica]
MFGAPPPLPGQKGYKARPSEAMQEEALRMEQRLAKLRSAMEAEQEAKRRSGGNAGRGQWRSGCPDRGSVKNYGKEVLARVQKCKERARANPKATSRPARAGREGTGAKERDRRECQRGGWGCRAKDVSQWTVQDTLDWLEVLGLGQYKEAFRANEISGPILLEVGLDDLDYLNVSILAHRKMLLKGIEVVKRGRPVTLCAPEQMQREQVQEPFHKADATPALAAPGPVSPPPKAKVTAKPSQVHWSQLEPLAAREVTGGEPPANLADGALDVQAEHESFVEAVMAWRSSGPESVSLPVDAIPSSSLSCLGNSDMWSNPLDDLHATPGSPETDSVAAAYTEVVENQSGSAPPQEQHRDVQEGSDSLRIEEGLRATEGTLTEARVAGQNFAAALAAKMDADYRKGAEAIASRREELEKELREERCKRMQALAKTLEAAEKECAEEASSQREEGECNRFTARVDEMDEMAWSSGGVLSDEEAFWPPSPPPKAPACHPIRAPVEGKLEVAVLDSELGYTPRDEPEYAVQEEDSD